MESVFEYSDYRTFLKDWFETQGKRRKGWSFGVWARQLKLASPSTLIMILRGDRNPGSALVGTLARDLKLSGPESSYFFDLVSLAKAKSDSRVRVLLMEKLRQQHPKREFRILNHDTFQAISSWHHYAIRELVQLRSFTEDPEWIAKKLKFPVSPKQVKDAIDTLLRLKLLKRSPNGRLTQASGQIDTATDIADEGLKRFHEQMLSHAKESVRVTPPRLREITGTTFSFNVRNLPQAKETIRKFQRDLCALCEEPNGDSVYQIQVSFFPLTKIESEGPSQ